MTEIDVPDWVVEVALKAWFSGEDYENADMSAFNEDMRAALTAIEQALTQQRGEAVYLIRGEFGGWTEQSKAAHEWWNGRENAPERRILYTTPQPSADAVREVPEGMVLVPRQPTEEMVAAWRSSVPDDSCTYHANDETWSAWCSESWSAMLSAASGEGV